MALQYVSREIEVAIRRRVVEGRRIIILYGARRVGKTTLVRHVVSGERFHFAEFSGDDSVVSDTLSSRDSSRILGMASGYDLVFIDEAQRIPEIGVGLKIIHDNLPALRLIVTGSSSFDLASQTREALTGRSWSFSLSPFSLEELSAGRNQFELERELERNLVYGFYPEVQAYDADIDRAAFLRELHASYLFKDIFEMGGIRQPRKIVDLLRLLAWQIGSEVSFSELATKLGMSKDTVSAYIDLLEKAFVLFRLEPFSRNLRNEVVRSPKIYFLDNGVRNATIGDFRSFAQRNDQGALWENFIVSERRKRLGATGAATESRFWRLHTGAEIDYVEESAGSLHGWEIKVSSDSKAKAPPSWSEAYPNATWALINRGNYLSFITGPLQEMP